MEQANRHLMTPAHGQAQRREDAAENSLSGWAVPCGFLPEQDQGANSSSLDIENDSFPGSQGRKSCCFPPGWGCLGWLALGTDT